MPEGTENEFEAAKPESLKLKVFWGSREWITGCTLNVIAYL